jgi:hypothetical protein
MGMQRGMLFLFGAAAGAIGATLIHNPQTRPALLSAMRGAIQAGEVAMARAETLMEDVEDLMAEARQPLESQPAEEKPKAKKSTAKGKKAAKA